MSQKNEIRELLADHYSAKRIVVIEAVQFQLAQKSDLVAGKTIANGLYVGDLSLVPVGGAFTGSLTVAVNNSVTVENIERVVKETHPAVELKGITFDSLTPTYAGTDVAGTKICSLIFTGYKITFG